MKEIKAIIQPGKLHAIHEALAELPGFPGMSVTQAEGCGPTTEQKGQKVNIRQELIEFSPKVRIEIVAADEQVDQIVGIIRNNAHTGRIGDGIIWVAPVEAFYRIRFENV